MNLNIYQLDAFSKGPFTGNPAAVCILNEWLPEELMQNIALENNLSETAFLVKTDNQYHIRWFTPEVEVALCGHATLASAHVLFSEFETGTTELNFTSQSGPLGVSRSGDLLTLDFPTDQLQQISPFPKGLSEALGTKIMECYRGKTDLLVVIKSHQTLADLKPDFSQLAQYDVRGILVTAPSFGLYDFVSRGFFPQCGINEDPATGSAHTSLTPYWSKRLNKKKLNACQISKRGGYFHCVNKGQRTLISGKAHLYLKGEIYI